MKISQWLNNEYSDVSTTLSGVLVPRSDVSYYSADGSASTSYDIELIADQSFDQYENSNTPQGVSVLVGDIMPWHDYVVLRTGEYTSVAVYGNKSDDLTFEDATVRTITRGSSAGYNNYYTVSDAKYDTVSVDISNPYYCYGNVIGVAYSLPSAPNVSSLALCGCVVVCALICVFRLIWSMRRMVR